MSSYSEPSRNALVQVNRSDILIRTCGASGLSTAHEVPQDSKTGAVHHKTAEPSPSAVRKNSQMALRLRRGYRFQSPHVIDNSVKLAVKIGCF